MQPIEIIVIIACVLVVGGVILASIINKKKGKSNCCGDCSVCSSCKYEKRKIDKEIDKE